MILSLPFLYRAFICRGTQRKPREYVVRAYTQVDIPEVDVTDLTPTIELEWTGYRHGHMKHQIIKRYCSSAGGIFLPVSKDGNAIRATAFEAALAEGGVRDANGTRPWVFDQWVFPTPGVRNGEERELDPRRFPTFSELSMQMNGEGRPPSTTNFWEAEQDARIALSSSILLVDGVVHTAMPEPAWRTAHRAGMSAVDIFPSPDHASHLHRLDRFAPSDLEPSSSYYAVRVEVMRPDLLRRDDIRELARHALDIWPKFRLRVSNLAGEIGGRGGLLERVDEIAATGKAPSSEQSVAILDLYAEARKELSRRGQRFWDKGHSIPDCAGAIASRWSKEREAYLTRNGGLQLDEADLEALDGIEFP